MLLEHFYPIDEEEPTLEVPAWHLKREDLKIAIEQSIMNEERTGVPEEVIMRKIHYVRGCKVMLDRDLAELYEVETKNLKRQVRRNMDRFPEDFMFELSKEEFDQLKNELNPGRWGGIRYAPMAFTEQGVAMLSSVLSSNKAVAVNIRIVRVFTRMRQMLSNNEAFLRRLEALEQKLAEQGEDIETIFGYLKELLDPEQPPRRRIGYKLPGENNEEE